MIAGVTSFGPSHSTPFQGSRNVSGASCAV